MVTEVIPKFSPLFSLEAKVEAEQKALKAENDLRRIEVDQDRERPTPWSCKCKHRRGKGRG